LRLGATVGLGGYIIANLMIRRLLIPTYEYRPRVRVKDEIKTDPTPLADMRLPKQFLIAIALIVGAFFILGMFTDALQPFSSAVFVSFGVVPLAAVGICFALSFLRRIEHEIIRGLLIAVLIISVIFGLLIIELLYIYAIIGLAGCLLDIWKSHKKEEEQ